MLKGEYSMRQRYLVCSLVILLTIGTLLPSNLKGNIKDQVNITADGNEIVRKSVTDWWPMFRHDLSHSGYSSSLAPISNATLWTYTVESSVHSSPAIVDGKAYFGSMDENVYCLDAINGVKIWQYRSWSSDFFVSGSL